MSAILSSIIEKQDKDLNGLQTKPYSGNLAEDAAAAMLPYVREKAHSRCVSATDKEWGIVQEKAKAHGMTVSTYLLRLAGAR